MKTFLLIGLGGFLGATARHYLGKGLTHWIGTALPVGTFAVNLVGCLLIGLVLGLADRGGLMSRSFVQFAAVGFCGGFTTFSSLVFEANSLTIAEKPLYAGGYILLSIALGWVAVLAGLALARLG